MKLPYKITRKILKLVASISKKIGKVNSIHLNKPPTELRKKNRIKTIYSSLEIERNTLTIEQMDWLRMIKDHLINSYHIEKENFEYPPFDSLGGNGRFYQLFGNQYEQIIEDLNEKLVA